jgi:putative addiction module component (TIGR02574 family)
MSIAELEVEILKLTAKDRAELANWLLGSLDGLSESEIESLWVEEAERRLDELTRGNVCTIPSEEVLRRARTMLS